MADTSFPVASNRLGLSVSRYLRQHAGNPVHWQPWDDAAFAMAREKDRPILLSIGYAACHWCHVMARESFADPATAAVMNALFICIKVDREERPDLDRFYLAAMAQMGKAAGWPLTAFLAPDMAPFDGGGYFPPEQRFGLPSFCDMLRETATRYASEPRHVGELGRTVTAAVLAKRPSNDVSIAPALLDRVCRTLAGGIDPLYGGFGMDGPKFLHAAGHELLLRAWDRTGDAAYLNTVAASVVQIANGAVFDHVGGGFHRYAVDDRWQVPHFEKMLNDNALMVRLNTQLWQSTKGALFAARVRTTIDWLLREMRLPAGAFGSSLAADSPGETLSEGAFYLWTKPELEAALGSRHHVFHTAFDAVTDERLAGRYALARASGDLDWTDDGAFDADLAALRIIRGRRPLPARDDKCLADWNALAITALVHAGRAFDRQDWIAEARGVFTALLENIGVGPRLMHCAIEGVHTATGLLDDYAALADAALALHEATGDQAYLDHALIWEQTLETLFWDEQEGGYFLTAADAEQRIPRQKIIDETASPAGNATMLGVLARLYALTSRDRFAHRFEGILRCFAGRMSRAHLQAATALCNSQALGQIVQVLIVGDGKQADLLQQTAAQCFVPDGLILRIPGGATLPEGHPGHGKAAGADGPVSYVCPGLRCLPPACTPEALTNRLSQDARRTP